MVATIDNICNILFLLTFFYRVVPLYRPRLELLRVHLFDLCPLRDEQGEVGAELEPVLDSLRRLLVVARLPEGVRAADVDLKERKRPNLSTFKTTPLHPR
jgi:hypothetical protein